jgi:AmmeMemoRadiSam system protein B
MTDSTNPTHDPGPNGGDETLPEHLLKPQVRPLQPVPVQAQNQKDGSTAVLVGLRDPSMLTPQMLVVPPPALQLVQQLRGDRTVHEIAEQFKAPVAVVIELVRKLDEHGLLWGPTFERLEGELKAKLHTAGHFPIGASLMAGKDRDEAIKAISEWLEAAEDPELDEPAVGIVAPHLDYARGWPVYAASYRCFDRAPRPDRVIVLGTNHFGIGDGVVATDLGFATPIGTVRADAGVNQRLRRSLGDSLFIDQLDHLPEHSIQLHLPWIQRVFGDVPVVAALGPDPLAPMIADDGGRVRREDFTAALREAIFAEGGRTYVVASSDLSHVGRAFGEPVAVDDRRKVDVERQDRETMGKYLGGDVGEFLEHVRWTKNPTRWCSIGNMTAALELVRPARVELVDYRQACDPQGNAMVTSCSMALLGGR